MRRTHGALQKTAAEFLLWAEEQENKHELIDGIIVRQTAATRNHERVAKRILVRLMAKIDEAAFDVNKGDFGVRMNGMNASDSVLFPDVVIDYQSERGEQRATTVPIVIIEVLSPTVDLRHHVDKLAMYGRLPSLVTYAVFNQDHPEVHCWRRGPEGWPTEAFVLQGMNATIDFSEINASLSLSDVYAPIRIRRTRNLDEHPFDQGGR